MLASVPGAQPVAARARRKFPRVLRPGRSRVFERAHEPASVDGFESAGSSERRTFALRRETTAAFVCAAV